MSGSIVVDLVDRDSGVDNVGLNDLLLNDWLDSLVDVLSLCQYEISKRKNTRKAYVVDVLSSNGRCYALALCGTLHSSLVLELRLFLNEIPLRGVMVAVVKLTVLDGTELGGMRLRKHFAILNGLYGAVVVILVNFLIDSSINLLVLMRLDSLLCYSGSNSFVNSSVMMAGL